MGYGAWFIQWRRERRFTNCIPDNWRCPKHTGLMNKLFKYTLLLLLFFCTHCLTSLVLPSSVPMLLCSDLLSMCLIASGCCLVFARCLLKMNCARVMVRLFAPTIWDFIATFGWALLKSTSEVGPTCIGEFLRVFSAHWGSTNHTHIHSDVVSLWPVLPSSQSCPWKLIYLSRCYRTGIMKEARFHGSVSSRLAELSGGTALSWKLFIPSISF